MRINKSRGTLRGGSLAFLGAALNILFIATFILPHPGGHSHESARRAACVNNLKQLGLALNLYASENKDRYPPIDSTKNNFMFEASLLYPEYLTNIAILACPSDPDNNPGKNFLLTSRHPIDGTPEGQVHPDCITDMSYGYIGWMITTDRETKAFFEKYDKMSPMDYDKNISVPEGMGNAEILIPEGMNDPEGDTIHRLSSGVDRYLITDMTFIGSDHEIGEFIIPIMWDQISTDISEFSHVPAAQNVLYLDGHVEYHKYDPANTPFPTTPVSAAMFGGRQRESIPDCE